VKQEIATAGYSARKRGRFTE